MKRSLIIAALIVGSSFSIISCEDDTKDIKEFTLDVKAPTTGGSDGDTGHEGGTTECPDC